MHICVRNRGLLRNVVDAQIVLRIKQELDDLLRPVRPVTQQPQVAKRFFRTPQFALLLAELIREVDQQLSIPMTLVLGKRQYARDIVIFRRLLLFREVSNDMASPVVSVCL